MTYCLGIITCDGLVMASDCRTNAGTDQANICRKMYSFVQAGERVFILLSSGNLSLTQSVITLLRKDFNEGRGLAAVNSMYEAARVVGDEIRAIARMDSAYLKRDAMKFNAQFILGGQVRGEKPGLYTVYPQGNPLRATKDTCFLLIGESKYGKPILDRGVTYCETSLEEAAKYAILSMDATMRSNVTVGPPIDLVLYHEGEFTIRHQRRFQENEPDLTDIHHSWEQSLRKAVAQLPSVRFEENSASFYVPKPEATNRAAPLNVESSPARNGRLPRPVHGDIEEPINAPEAEHPRSETT
ncbi:MAG: peptidase [Capsulimonadaceae bacterium]